MKRHSKDLNPGLMYVLAAFPNKAETNQDHVGGKYFLGRKVKRLKLLRLEQRELKDGFVTVVK